MVSINLRLSVILERLKMKFISFCFVKYLQCKGFLFPQHVTYTYVHFFIV